MDETTIKYQKMDLINKIVHNMHSGYEPYKHADMSSSIEDLQDIYKKQKQVIKKDKDEKIDKQFTSVFNNLKEHVVKKYTLSENQFNKRAKKFLQKYNSKHDTSNLTTTNDFVTNFFQSKEMVTYKEQIQKASKESIVENNNGDPAIINPIEMPKLPINIENIFGNSGGFNDHNYNDNNDIYTLTNIEKKQLTSILSVSMCANNPSSMCTIQ